MNLTFKFIIFLFFLIQNEFLQIKFSKSNYLGYQMFNRYTKVTIEVLPVLHYLKHQQDLN
jgi:hypothetical protein